jgi:hypothetical protein
MCSLCCNLGFYLSLGGTPSLTCDVLSSGYVRKALVGCSPILRASFQVSPPAINFHWDVGDPICVFILASADGKSIS